MCRTKGLITTISKACDLIRTLVNHEWQTAEEEGEIKLHLQVLFDRMVQMGVYSLPASLSLTELQVWSESTALEEIQLLQHYLELRKADMSSQTRENTRRLFMDPQKAETMVPKRVWVPEHGLP